MMERLKMILALAFMCFFVIWYLLSPYYGIKAVAGGLIIQAIKITVNSDETAIEYICNSESGKQVNLKVSEYRAFSTKQELLASL